MAEDQKPLVDSLKNESIPQEDIKPDETIIKNVSEENEVVVSSASQAEVLTAESSVEPIVDSSDTIKSESEVLTEAETPVVSIETTVDNSAEANNPVLEAESVIETPEKELASEIKTETKVAVSDEKVPEAGATVLETETPKEIKSTDDLEKNKIKNNTILIIAVVLVFVLGLIYFLTRDLKQEFADFNAWNGKVTVSDAPEEGTVTILDEIKGEVKIIDEDGVAVGNTEPVVETKANINVDVATNAKTVYGSNKIPVVVFIGNTRNNPNSADCSLVYPLQRKTEKKYASNMINSVLSLLEPLNSAEKEAGYVSVIPAGTFLQYVKVSDSGVATVNFSGSISKIAGSCAVTSARSQIEKTLMQFNQVKSVIICINGNCKEDEILQP